MHIVGTAGHVDHGKSALIAALSGTHPDRLIEEQIRGMTLDLGFAYLRFDDGIEAGIVDVPGHQRFLHNMLAGAAGMELLLLVVDAVEGVMPQTLEHLQILQFLNVRRVVVAATKTDLIEEPDRANALTRIGQGLQGTIAASARKYGVSCVTGEGVDAVKRALHDELAAMAPRDANAPPYLPIDRVFALPGLGTIVTGTLMQGSIAVGDTLAVEPGGNAAHVRSIGVFGSTRPRIDAGARVALSLPGIDRRRLERGHAVVGRELSARRSFAVRFVPLPSAGGLLRRRTPVRGYIGSAEILGTLVIDGLLGAGRELKGQLHLREPVVVFPGLRFVLRRPSPMTLLGGGHVEAFDVERADDGYSPHERAVRAVLRAKLPDAVELTTIAAAANLREHAARDAVERLVECGDAVPVKRPAAYVDGEFAAGLLTQMQVKLEAAHAKEPWAMGVTSIALARDLRVPETVLVRVAEHYVEAGRVMNRRGYYAATSHRPSFTAPQHAFFHALVPIQESRPFLPVRFSDAASLVKGSAVAGVSKAFDTMLARGAFVKVGDDLYRGSQIAKVRERIERHFRDHRRMTAAEFRDLLGTSRKHAVPMLEWLDSHAITIRDGDYRTLRQRSIGDEEPT